MAAEEEYQTGPRFIGPAIIQLNGLHAAGVLGTELENATVEAPGTPVFDINGSVLFHRVALHRDGVSIGYADIAHQQDFGAPLLAVGTGAGWSSPEVLKAGCDVALERHSGPADVTARLVAYSYPKLAVQILRDGEELFMLEVGSWEPVPERTDRPQGEPPGNFERWSLLEELDEAVAGRRRERLERAVGELSAFSEVGGQRLISAAQWGPILIPPITFSISRDLHYSPVVTDHSVCYELRGQRTPVWCVAASVQMVLDFYRYDYDQTRVAAALKLGTLENPNGLPYSRVHDVVTVLEALTGSALTAAMYTPGSFDLFVTEVYANRPMISFIWGHSRTVAGYIMTCSTNPGLKFHGLLVYDPWPPNSGVITRWENYDAITHMEAYTAAVSLH